MVNTNKANVSGIIMQNSALFAHGSVFSGDVLDTMFGIQLPAVADNNPINIFNSINRRNLQRLSAYTKLNKMLAERGISIHQKTVAGAASYHVQTVAELPKDVKYYRRKGKRAIKRSSILLQAYNQLAIPGIE